MVTLLRKKTTCLRKEKEIKAEQLSESAQASLSVGLGRDWKLSFDGSVFKKEVLDSALSLASFGLQKNQMPENWLCRSFCGCFSPFCVALWKCIGSSCGG